MSSSGGGAIQSGNTADSSEIQEQYKEYSEKLYNYNNKTQEELDKSLISLSTILIGVNLTLRQQIAASNPKIDFPPLLLIALTVLTLCVASVLASHYLSISVNKTMIRDIDAGRHPHKSHSRSRFIELANTFSGWIFFLGLILTMLFAGLGTSGRL